MQIDLLKGYSRSVFRFFFNSPSKILINGFLLAVLIGAGALMLPGMTGREGLKFIDALFTATSATCVTGLSVIDVGSTLALPGKFTLMVLMQIGGLGIMTFSTLFILLAGRKPRLADQVLIRDTFTRGGERSIRTIIKDIILFTAVFEFIGFVVLFGFFLIKHEGLTQSFLNALFHSISAFCNAGFSLFSNSMMDFRENWVLNLTLAMLIISGGLGFPVISELKQSFPLHRRSWQRLSLHSKIVISSTAVLLIVSTAAIFLMEWDNSLKTLSLPGRLLASFFQAVTSRTAGFNTLPIGMLANETLFFLIVLMFIGAGPGSCAGGVKITTVSTLAFMGFSRFQGNKRSQAFKRTIPESSVDRSISVVLISAMIIFVGILLLLITEVGEVSHVYSRGKFLELAFETVSAFGTVGLSAGATSTLSMQGKIIIILMMFIGRVGPLTIVLAISQKERPMDYYYAEEDIMVG